MSAATNVWNAWRRYLRAESGVAAVELALVLGPAVWMLLAIFEVAMIGFAQNALDFAMTEAGRRVRTGEVWSTSMTEQQLKDDICGSMGSFINADCNRLHLDVDTFDGFIDVANPSPVNPDGTLNTGQFGFNPGVASSIVMVRGFYEWNVITPFLEQFYANVGNKRLLSSTILFRNEPW